ncbi:hypothetical protein [Nodularia sp. NIES-3585]|nr:hypothetical protein [Nodularia sp. NIES-3585]
MPSINTNLQECIRHLTDTKYEIYRLQRKEKPLPSELPDEIKDSFTNT